jgi:hypothetical protein
MVILSFFVPCRKRPGKKMKEQLSSEWAAFCVLIGLEGN